MAIAGLVLTILIFRRQDRQLKDLKVIGKETEDTARKLHTDSSVKDMADRVFGLKSEPTIGGERFRCFFPVDFNQRPLPFIFSGDYHALQVLQNLLGQRLEPVPVRQTASFGGAQAISVVPAASGRNVLSEDTQNGGEIYLCSPQVNERLKDAAPAVELRGTSTEAVAPSFKGIALPCWFANANWFDPAKKVIRVHDSGLSLPLLSPSESDYEEAKNLQPGVAYEFRQAIRKDLGILLRLTHQQRVHLVVAGIHQYGTWIAGEFLYRLTHDETFHSEISRGSDFVAVVWGEFDSKNFRVINCGIHDEYLWIREEESWRRLTSAAPPASKFKAAASRLT